MLVEVTAEDIACAYDHHTSWWVNPEWTPISLALLRMGFKRAATTAYGVNVDGSWHKLPSSAVDRMREWESSRVRNKEDAVYNRGARDFLRKTSTNNIDYWIAESVTRRASEEWTDILPFSFELELGSPVGVGEH